MEHAALEPFARKRHGWRELAWRERASIAISATNLFAATALAAVFAAVGGRLLVVAREGPGTTALLAPFALLAGLAVLAYVAPLFGLALLQLASIALALRRRPLGHLLAASGQTASSIFLLLRLDRPASIPLELPLACLWLAGASLALFCATAPEPAGR